MRDVHQRILAMQDEPEGQVDGALSGQVDVPDLATPAGVEVVVHVGRLVRTLGHDHQISNVVPYLNNLAVSDRFGLVEAGSSAVQVGEVDCLQIQVDSRLDTTVLGVGMDADHQKYRDHTLQRPHHPIGVGSCKSE